MIEFRKMLNCVLSSLLSTKLLSLIVFAESKNVLPYQRFRLRFNFVVMILNFDVSDDLHRAAYPKSVITGNCHFNTDNEMPELSDLCKLIKQIKPHAVAFFYFL